MSKVISGLVNGCSNLILRYFNSSKIKPKLVVFEVTERCNSRCVHCNIWKTQPSYEMSIKEIKIAFSDSLLSDVESIILTGGEPTVRSDLVELSLALHVLCPKACIWLSTNGLLVKKVKDFVEAMENSHIEYGTGISIDGIGNKHDRMRGVQGNFANISYLIGRLKGKKISLGFTLSSETIKNMDGVTTYAKNNNLPLINQAFDKASYYHNIEEDMENRDVSVKVRQLPNTILKKHWLSMLNQKLKYKCFALFSFFVLHSNGDVSPCFRFSDLVVGNLRKNTLSEIWSNDLMINSRKVVKACSNQCVNDWALHTSLKSCYYPILLFKIRKLLSK